MRNLIAAVLSLSFAATSAMAGGAPLPPGKPAGVKHAQADSTVLLIGAGIAGTIAAIAFGTASSGNPGGQVTLTTVPATSTG